MTATSRTITADDRWAILDLVARYYECVDRYDLEGVAAIFALDAVTDYGPGRGGEVVGRNNIRARIERGQGEFRRTHHQLGQTLLHATATGVTGTTYVTASHERWNGSYETLCLRYVDGFADESGEHEWLISSRRVEAAVVNGFEGVPWTWVPRAQPER